jgi:hypothetical protein
MSRIVPAAYQLMAEVEEQKPKFKVTYGKPDGIDVIREFTFDAATSKWLVPILGILKDTRIKSVNVNGKHRATVRFVASHWADHKETFMLARIDEALNGPKGQ